MAFKTVILNQQTCLGVCRLQAALLGLLQSQCEEGVKEGKRREGKEKNGLALGVV